MRLCSRRPADRHITNRLLIRIIVSDLANILD